jgi:3-hydroxyisobutyrate dehydrogenase-like beta-hydroxyacid dehydrogenase
MSRIMPVLEQFSSAHAAMGTMANGRAASAENQAILAAIAEVVCESIAPGEKLNPSSQRLLSVVGAGAGGSWFPDHRGQSMLENQFNAGSMLPLLPKDLLICQGLAQDLDISMSTGETAIKDCRDVFELGDGGHDIPGLIRFRRETDRKYEK